MTPQPSKERVGEERLASPFRLPSSAWLIMLFALLFIAVGGYLAHNYNKLRGKERFQFQSLLLRDAIAERMHTYEQVLRGGIGLFMSSQEVSRKEWHDYIANARLNEFYPGIQAMGYSQWLSKAQLPAHEAKIQAEGFPEYQVHPKSATRENYMSIVYIEPFDWRNRRAFGYDLSSEPVRRRAIDRAISTRQAAISGKITLVQEVAQDVQSGFLMCLPLFEQGSDGKANNTPRGIVYAAFRMNNLIEGVLAGDFAELNLAIYDGYNVTPQNLMFVSAKQPLHPLFSSVLPLKVGGHVWSLAFSSNENFSSEAEALQNRLLPIFGGLFLVLLFYFLYQNAKARHQEALFTKQMMANEKRFRLVIEASPSALVMVNAVGTMTLVNQHAEKLFKYSRDELLGRNVSMLLPDEARGRHGQHMAGYMRHPDAKNMSQRTDLQGQCSDGSRLNIEVGLTPIMFSDGQAVLATINDVSERKAAEKERERYTNELERINRELDSFAYVASHDLKSPLRGIEQLAEWLQEDLGENTNETVQKYLNLIGNRVQRMMSLLDGLLAFSRVGRVGVDISFTEVEVLVRDVFSLVNVRPDFVLHLDNELPTFDTARVPLELVFRNLFSNAIKHHDKSAGTIHVGCEALANEYQFCVADDGPGIPERFQQKVFDMFQTLKPRDEVEGSGIGLSLVKKTIESLGGKIWLVSSQEGCRFYFTWPKQLGGRHNDDSPSV